MTAKINALIRICTAAERYRIAMMLNNAADYMRSVVIMEVVATRVEELEPEEFREARESTDCTRSNDHTSFIASVDAVNKICDAHGVERIYTGGSVRREYGDFALELVSDVFINRH